MLPPTEIKRKAARLYLPFLRAWLRHEAFFPITFSTGPVPLDYLTLREDVRELQAQSKERRGSGYSLEYEVQHKRSAGLQTVPVRAIIATEQDFLSLIEKNEEFSRFQQDIALIREKASQLAAWMERSPQKVIDHHGYWPKLLAVCRYFQDHPRPALYIRELPINVHTKFIEQHRGILSELLEQCLAPEAIQAEAATFERRFGLRAKESLLRVRLLDAQLHARYGLPITDVSVPLAQSGALDLLRGQCCVVTENEMTFLTLPPHKDTFALFGGGFKVSDLALVPWLSDCPIFYWGDLDAQGFQILSSLRALFPHVTSVMMDWETFSAFSAFCVTGTSTPVRQLPYLTPEEHALFLHLAENTLRLEQEHISQAYALEKLSLPYLR
jgi:hypothetical protein